MDNDGYRYHVDFCWLIFFTPGSDGFHPVTWNFNWDPQTETSKIMKAGDNDITTWMLHVMVKVWLSAVTMKIGQEVKGCCNVASKCHYPRRLLESSWKNFFIVLLQHQFICMFRSAKKKHVLTKTTAYRKKTASSKFMVLHFAVATVTTGGSNAQIQ